MFIQGCAQLFACLAQVEVDDVINSSTYIFQGGVQNARGISLIATVAIVATIAVITAVVTTIAIVAAVTVIAAVVTAITVITRYVSGRGVAGPL
ncbi:hypothetical protein L1889_10030 [Paenalcaligenes niemegkensis]|uniref:hypothetical protein n=1 Tax=Paenalcaligenes niemegkensis TaxID=2895469 RepID=UPI001EE9A6C6|nr:hypothetical protein [Paenalcaligenes niemegkensis]MCQ9616998.1 hypothetical protein [Paenalcaligenes niemegkensis]